MKNKVVIITGASSGIGKALAIEFAKLGAHIVITGRNEARLNEVAEILDGMNTRNLCLQLDVAKEKDNEILVNETVKTFGKIDILINNAGISMRALFEEIEMDVFKKVMDINFYGTLYATKYCLPRNTKNQRLHCGCVVN